MKLIEYKHNMFYCSVSADMRVDVGRQHSTNSMCAYTGTTLAERALLCALQCLLCFLNTFMLLLLPLLWLAALLADLVWLLLFGYLWGRACSPVFVSPLSALVRCQKYSADCCRVNALLLKFSECFHTCIHTNIYSYKQRGRC